MNYKLLASSLALFLTATLACAQDAASTPFRSSSPPEDEAAPAPTAGETPTPRPTVKPSPRPTPTPKQEQKASPTPAPTAKQEQKAPPTPAPTPKQEQKAAPTPAPAAAAKEEEEQEQPPALIATPSAAAPQRAATAAPARRPALPPKTAERPERDEPVDARDEGSGAARAIKALEKEWEASIVTHDPSVIERLVADDFVGVSSTGKIGDKLTLLYEAKRDKNTYKTAAARQLSVRTYGAHVAVVLGVTRESGSDASGRSFDHNFRFVDTWMERAGKWQCIAAHAAIATKR
ncbi:MAG: DUF4440 domain-containing protein [Verrucomicrobiota bacterium]|nr:DUF4440 domain-containing protein [Verrucomicrobiota bacterium]